MGIIVDGVAYTPAMIRALILDRHQLATTAQELAQLLRLRSEALNRVAAENDRLRHAARP